MDISGVCGVCMQVAAAAYIKIALPAVAAERVSIDFLLFIYLFIGRIAMTKV
jgi:energy-converting hydrogenase Eha subunit C